MVQRIAVVGNGVGGKSTAARELSARLGLPLYSVDQVQFEAGWKPADPSRVAAWHSEILRSDTWIIDGWGVDGTGGSPDSIPFPCRLLPAHSCFLLPTSSAPEKSHLTPVSRRWFACYRSLFWPLLVPVFGELVSEVFVAGGVIRGWCAVSLLLGAPRLVLA